MIDLYSGGKWRFMLDTDPAIIAIWLGPVGVTAYKSAETGKLLYTAWVWAWRAKRTE